MHTKAITKVFATDEAAEISEAAAVATAAKTAGGAAPAVVPTCITQKPHQYKSKEIG